MFKKSLLFLSTLFICNNALAEGIEEKNLNLTTNPLGYVLLLPNAKIDYAYDEQNAFGFNVLVGFNFVSAGFDRTYFFDSFYEDSPFINAGYQYSGIKTEEFSFDAHSISVNVGKKWLWESGFNLNLFGGTEYIILENEHHHELNGFPGDEVRGFNPKIGFTIGRHF